MDLIADYSDRRTRCLEPLARRLSDFLSECLIGLSRIDRITARAKSVERFASKAGKIEKNGSAKYDDPLNQIQDQIGVRIVCFYLQDVPAVESVILEYFRPIESRLIVPDEQSKFGYFGKHLILIYPDDVVESDNPPRPGVFELQIKTLFQHAWSEAEHDLAYKSHGKLSPENERMIAFTAAQAWGADKMFDDLFRSAAND